MKTINYSTPEGFDCKNENIDYGEITEVEYVSKTTGCVRKCNVYTPPGYKACKIYPILFLLHGIGGTHDEWLEGNPNEIISNLITAKEASPMIVVMPNVRAMKNDNVPLDLFEVKHIAAFNNFINDLKDDLMPFIKENYSVSEKREQTAIAGLSMGGKESLFIGVTMPEIFGYIGAFEPAPGLISSNRDLPAQIAPDNLTLPGKYKDTTFILINTGNQDNVVGDNPFNYHKVLERNNVKNIYYTIDGGHDFTVWKNGLYHFAKNIF